MKNWARACGVWCRRGMASLSSSHSLSTSHRPCLYCLLLIALSGFVVSSFSLIALSVLLLVSVCVIRVICGRGAEILFFCSFLPVLRFDSSLFRCVFSRRCICKVSIFVVSLCPFTDTESLRVGLEGELRALSEAHAQSQLRHKAETAQLESRLNLALKQVRRLFFPLDFILALSPSLFLVSYSYCWDLPLWLLPPGRFSVCLISSSQFLFPSSFSPVSLLPLTLLHRRPLQQLLPLRLLPSRSSCNAKTLTLLLFDLRCLRSNNRLHPLRKEQQKQERNHHHCLPLPPLPHLSHLPRLSLLSLTLSSSRVCLRCVGRLMMVLINISMIVRGLQACRKKQRHNRLRSNSWWMSYLHWRKVIATARWRNRDNNTCDCWLISLYWVKTAITAKSRRRNGEEISEKQWNVFLKCYGFFQFIAFSDSFR